MIYSYPGLFMKTNDIITVSFKDFNNVTTQGKDLNEAINMSQDLLTTILLDYKQNNKPLPKASDIKCYDIDFEVQDLNTKAGEIICTPADCFVSYVSVDPEEYAKIHFNKLDKKTLSIPHWLNVKAQAKGINFSKVLTEALIAKINA